MIFPGGTGPEWWSSVVAGFYRGDPRALALVARSRAQTSALARSHGRPALQGTDPRLLAAVEAELAGRPHVEAPAASADTLRRLDLLTMKLALLHKRLGN